MTDCLMQIEGVHVKDQNQYKGPAYPLNRISLIY